MSCTGSCIQLQHGSGDLEGPVAAVSEQSREAPIDQTAENRSGARQKIRSQEQAQEDAVRSNGETETERLGREVEETEGGDGVEVGVVVGVGVEVSGEEEAIEVVRGQTGNEGFAFGRI